MADVQPVSPVKYFIAVLFRDADRIPALKQELQQRWGTLDFEGPDHPFFITDYYEPEMGAPLFRRLLSFEKLLPPQFLADMKLECNALEDLLRENNNRTVNLDIGYLDHNKIVLASAKAAGQKIYLDKGIYADLVCRYKNGAYRPFEWTFPDFKDGRYDTELSSIRTSYLHCRKHTAPVGQ
jgi:hypothetical protein